MLLKINDVLVVTDPLTGEVVRAANRKEIEGLRGICRDEKGRIQFDEAALAARKEHYLSKRAQFIERIAACEKEIKEIDPAAEFDDAGEKVRLQVLVDTYKKSLDAANERLTSLSAAIRQMEEKSSVESKRASEKVAGLMRQLETVTPLAAQPPKIETVIVEKIVEVEKQCNCLWCRFVRIFN